jgi:hypothetical protein
METSRSGVFAIGDVRCPTVSELTGFLFQCPANHDHRSPILGRFLQRNHTCVIECDQKGIAARQSFDMIAASLESFKTGRLA